MQTNLEGQGNAELIEAPAALRHLASAGVDAGPLEEAAAPVTPDSGRWYMPSMADVLFVVLIIWLFLAGPNGWNALLADGDTGWHIRVGDWIREHRAFPRQDFFSFSKPGAPWFAWEWGSEVWMSLLHEWAGLKGVLLGMGLILPIYLLILVRHMMWRGATALVAMTCVFLVCGSSAIHYLARPHLFTFLFLSVALWMIDRDRRRPDGWLWMLIPLSAVWTNLHGGFLSLVACLGLISLGYLVQAEWRRGSRYGLAALGALAASLVNPYGYHLHLHVADYMRSEWIREMVDEFQSPKFRSEAIYFYEGFLIVGAMMAFRLMQRRDWPSALLIIGWAHMSLSSVRHVPIYLLVAGPAIAAELSAIWNEFAASRPRRSLWKTLDGFSRDLNPGFRSNSGWLCLPVVVLIFAGSWVRWPQDFPVEKFPTAFLNRHLDEIQGQRVLAPDEWGDYLLYRLYPSQRVFFDGRSDFYGPEVGKQFLALINAGQGWEKLMDEYRIQVAFIPTDWPLQQVLSRQPDWQLVDSTGKVFLYRRRLDRNAAAF